MWTESPPVFKHGEIQFGGSSSRKDGGTTYLIGTCTLAPKNVQIRPANFFESFYFVGIFADI